MFRRLSIALAVALTLAGTVHSALAGAVERASLPDIEDEVMCPTCGTALSLANSPQAERQREFIRARIELGQTKGQIKDALVAEFGEEVLALPQDEGFDLAAYIVPAGVVLAAATLLGFGVARWRRRGSTPTDPPAADLSAADAARLERDLSRYEL